MEDIEYFLLFGNHGLKSLLNISRERDAQQERFWAKFKDEKGPLSQKSLFNSMLLRARHDKSGELKVYYLSAPVTEDRLWEYKKNNLALILNKYGEIIE